MRILILFSLVLLGISCNSIKILYKIQQPFTEKEDETCCTANCNQKLTLKVETLHYLNGTNYLWITLNLNPTMVKNENIELDLFSQTFEYKLVEKQIKDFEASLSSSKKNLVYENITFKGGLKKLKEKLQQEEINLEIVIDKVSCQSIRLKPDL